MNPTDPKLAKTIQKLISLARAHGGRCTLIHQPGHLQLNFTLPAPHFQIVAIDAQGQEAELPATLQITNTLKEDFYPAPGVALLILFDIPTGAPPSIVADPQPFFTYTSLGDPK